MGLCRLQTIIMQSILGVSIAGVALYAQRASLFTHYDPHSSSWDKTRDTLRASAMTAVSVIVNLNLRKSYLEKSPLLFGFHGALAIGTLVFGCSPETLACITRHKSTHDSLCCKQSIRTVEAAAHCDCRDLNYEHLS